MTPEESLDKYRKEILYPYLNRVWRAWDNIFEEHKEELESLLKEERNTMTLLEKLEVIKYQAKVIIDGNPDIDYLSYKINDAPMSEIRIVEFEMGTKGGLQFILDDYKYQLRIPIDNKVSIFVWSKPVKISKEAEIEELP
jgi:hypothetical protein